MGGKLVFISGGIRSGKSEFAENIVSELGKDIVYVATAGVLDVEMEHRVELHRKRRPANWMTVEEQLNVTQTVTDHGSKCDVIMIDCLTMLISNMMFNLAESNGTEFKKEWQGKILQEISLLARVASETKADVVIVSNEVGMTLVADNYLGRQFQELVGKANQIVAKLADEAYIVIAGHPIDLKKGRS